jgi:hypothetical protein
MRFDYLRELHDFLQWRMGDAILLAEAYILPAENLKYFGPAGDRMHMILNFQVNQTMFYALASGTANPSARGSWPYGSVRRSASGAFSCAPMMNWTSAGSVMSSASTCSTPSPPTRTCVSMGEASGGTWPPCSAVISDG